MNKILTLAFVGLLFIAGCQSDPVDTSKRGFDESRLDQLNTLERYDYFRTVPAPKNNMILELFLNILGFIAQILHSTLGYVLLAGLIGLLIWLVIKNVKAPRNTKIDHNDQFNISSIEDLVFANYERLIQEAMHNKNYRLVIRFTYLNVLKNLHERGLIEWHKEKTNYEYYIELNQTYNKDFASILRIYEHVWYGHFTATEGLCSNNLKLSENILKKISK